jgi:hypothetical protein
MFAIIEDKLIKTIRLNGVVGVLRNREKRKNLKPDTNYLLTGVYETF